MSSDMSMLRLRVGLVVLLSLALVWATAYFELDRSHSSYIHEAEIRNTVQARVFDENMRSTIKRIDQILLVIRPQWKENWEDFSQVIQQCQNNIKDIAFQVAIIDKNGILAFSNLAKSSDRTDLSNREHFKVHRQSPTLDHLFISKPVKGKVSGKWSIQFTRPILNQGQFDGVLVVSISPDLIANFSQTLGVHASGSVTLVRDSGEIMSRFPHNEALLGLVIKDVPYSAHDAPTSGIFFRVATTDGIERMYGYFRDTEFGLNYVVGESMQEILSPYKSNRKSVIVASCSVSALTIFLFYLLLRSLISANKLRLDLEVAKTHAEQANMAKSRFLATMSHEIRTPMNGILGIAQLLLMPNLKEDDRRDYVRTIHSSGNALLSLLNDILDFSKIEAGKIQLDSVILDPANILSEIETLFLGSAQAKNLQLMNQWLGPKNQRYHADVHRIIQMISNMVGNAIKFSAKGSVRLEAMEIERNCETALLEFSVIDTGIGIPEDKRDLLFKPFSQTENSTTREFGGSGLGLSIVSQLAKLMGGDVGVESVVGQGSRFWFRVWVKCFTEGEEASRQERATQDESNASAHTEQLSGRVLVVEDNMVNRMVIESLLDEIGVTVTLLTDGQQAVDAITRGDQHPDLILMDLNMPVMDGYTAVTLIRRWEADQHRDCLPIIALTADAFEEDRQKCLAIGMDDFLTKPIQLNALKLTLSQWLSVKTQD